MPEREPLQSQFSIMLAGEPASGELMRHLEHVTVETSLHLPDLATLVLHDPALEWVDHASLAPGVAVRVDVEAGASQATIFDGEIVELEPEFGATQRLTVRAFDRLHRLARGTHARSFVNVGDDDLVRRIAGEAGLSAEIRPVPPEIYPYVLQANETNLAFLQRRAAALGYLLYVEGSTLCYVAPESQRPPIGLAWGDTLYEFRPRMSTIDQVSRTIVRGWDPGAKREVLGEARSGSLAPKVGLGGDGGAVAQRAFQIEAQDQVADQPVRSHTLADRLALAAAERHASRFIEAEGLCAGQPGLVAGATVMVGGVGQRFGGSYLVTSATHRTSAGQGYQTDFTISGMHPSTLLGLLAERPATPPGSGLVIGVVADNDDPEGLGRVRLTFPWLSPDHTSDWARVLSVGAGSRRGLEFLPEVDDEVLVGFEMGDIHYPYVLGGLWNGVDAPPLKPGQALKGGAVRQRAIVSRTGHTILLDDDARGGITIQDASGNRIVLSVSRNTLTIEAQGDISVTAGANLSLEATGNLSLKGKSVQINGDSTVDVSGAMINLN